MKTHEILSEVVKHCDEPTIFISSSGRTAECLFKIAPQQTLFIDCIGAVTPVGIGLALACKNNLRIVVVDSDGSHLFGLQSLVALANCASLVADLIVIVMANGVNESSGGTHLCKNLINWQEIAKAFGLYPKQIDHPTDLSKRDMRGFAYLIANIDNTGEQHECTQKTIDGIESKYQISRYIEKHTGRRILIPCVRS